MACSTRLAIWMAVSACLSAAAPAHVPGRLLAGRRQPVDGAVLARAWRMHQIVERRHVPELGLHVLEVPEESADAVRRSLEATGLFDYVEPDYYAEPGSTPNDPSYVAQWHLSKIGGAQAWSLTTGSPGVVVALVDSGISAAHPDLASKIVPGWNFVRSNADTSDVTGHGTEVAGTVAAATNNGIGVAGVSWGSLVMPLVVVDKDSFAAYSDIAAAIQYAADHQVRVINVSIGGTASSSTLQNAVDYAWRRGAMVFAAAMNNGGSRPYYPAACSHAVAVAATDESDHAAAFSNFGSWVTLSAPGADILTTVDGGGYGFLNGTSFSAPIVAGVAALMLAANPQLGNDEIVSMLIASADPPPNGGFDPYLGWGRVNAGRAVKLASPLPAAETPSEPVSADPPASPAPSPAPARGQAPNHGLPRRDKN
jgi:subtilisin family serine protease